MRADADEVVMRTPTEKVMSHVDIVGECWIYDGPAHVRDGWSVRLPVRVLHEATYGYRVTPKHRLVAGCMSEGCIRPTHQALVHRNVVNATWQCECGNPKDIGDEGCARCVFLDGPSEDVIAVQALRSLDGPLTVPEMSEYLGIADTNIYKALSRLERRGRVVSVEDESHKTWQRGSIRKYWLTGDGRDAA